MSSASPRTAFREAITRSDQLVPAGTSSCPAFATVHCMPKVWPMVAAEAAESIATVRSGVVAGVTSMAPATMRLLVSSLSKRVDSVSILMSRR